MCVPSSSNYTIPQIWLKQGPFKVNDLLPCLCVFRHFSPRQNFNTSGTKWYIVIYQSRTDARLLINEFQTIKAKTRKRKKEKKSPPWTLRRIKHISKSIKSLQLSFQGLSLKSYGRKSIFFSIWSSHHWSKIISCNMSERSAGWCIL